MNPMQIIQMLRSGKNPQQLIMDILQQNQSPIGQNLLKLAQQGNTTQIEKIARNMCASQGKDFDKEFASFRQSLGL